MRYVEISLAKQREEKESTEVRCSEQTKKADVSIFQIIFIFYVQDLEENNNILKKEISEKDYYIGQQTKKIKKFNDNQD